MFDTKEHDRPGGTNFYLNWEKSHNIKFASIIVRKSITTWKFVNEAGNYSKCKALETVGKIIENVEDIYTSGDKAISAHRKGDYVECIFYTLQTIGHSAELILTISDISVVKEKMSKYLGTQTSTVSDSIKKAGIVIDIAIAAIKVGLEIYNYFHADNSVEKRMCVEKIAGHIVDLGLGLASKAVPHILAITASWELTMSFLCKISPNPLVEKALRKPGQALVFLFEYRYFPVIPGAICEMAYENGMSEMQTYRDEWCKNGHPVIILISD